MELTAGHWVYLAGVVVIIAVMIMRKNVVVPAVAATLATAWVFTGSFATGLSSVFNASLTAASELFNIFLIIALVTALLGALQALGADRRMVKPFQRVMSNGHIAFWTLVAVAYVISLFFWPTPAVPLIGAILLPAAIRAGLPAMAAAMAIAIAGQGMALSSDYIIQVAPGLSATAAGASTEVVADRAMVLSLITGGVALVLAYVMVMRSIKAPSAQNLVRWRATASAGTLLAGKQEKEVEAESAAATVAPAETAPPAATAAPLTASVSGGSSAPPRIPSSGRANAPVLSYDGPVDDGATTDDGHDDGQLDDGGPMPDCVKRSKLFAALVPVVFLALVGYMMLGKFTGLVAETSGGDAAALVGGVAALLLLVATITLDGRGALETCATHVVDGLVFAFKAMGVVLPIAGFFFIGNADFATRIMSLPEDATPPSFLFDLVASVQSALPSNALFVTFGVLIVGMLTGLDGSGFSGLPLTGSLAGALGPAVDMDPATLAAVGQMGSIWTGGGVLIAWSSLIAVAGFARVPVLELARRCFFPVVAGLVTSTIVAALLM
jgi:hypothetical protein